MQRAQRLVTCGCAIIALAYTAVDRADPVALELGKTRVHLSVEGGPYRIGSDAVVAWVRRAVSIVDGYYDGFPVPELSVRVVAVDGPGVRSGRAYAGRTSTQLPAIRVSLGRDVADGQLLGDWVLVHEMAHLALPEVGREHSWLAEGLATYVEGVARVQAGNMSAVELWQEDVQEMPKGLPAQGDAGLDRTHTWARTYWGGALFCLVADVGIRERTENRFGLQDALRAVLRKSGGMITSWPVDRVFRIGDEATGTTVLADLYAAMRSEPATPDLPELWRRLGIAVAGDIVTLTTGTREAAIREAITRPRPKSAAAGR